MSNPVKTARVCIYINTYIFPNTYNVTSQTDHTVTCFSDCKTCHVDYKAGLYTMLYLDLYILFHLSKIITVHKYTQKDL